MKLIIDIPKDYKRVIDNLVVDGKGYLLPQEVEDKLSKAVKNGKVIPKDATNGDIMKAMFPSLEVDIIDNTVLTDMDNGAWYSLDWWSAPYESEG